MSNAETEHIGWRGICLSCKRWNGVICDASRRKREATDDCSSRSKKYEQNPAYNTKKKEFEA